MMGRWFLVLFVSFCCISTGFAAEQVDAPDTKQPIEITAQTLELIQQQRQSIFTGNVVAKQGDMVLSADKLTVFLLKKQDQIDRLEAVGTVKVVQLDRVATADRAIFYQFEGKLVLSGHAVVVQDSNKVSGDEIDIYLKENRSVIKSSKNGRVKAVIVPVRKQDQ
jgi:lipopolysaccharide export system protein LptA